MNTHEMMEINIVVNQESNDHRTGESNDHHRTGFLQQLA